MKIISGIYKGRNIKGYDISGTRPTMERVKESLFATIQNNLKDSIVLDLFSGSGNLGLEALSEGAKFAYLVDYNKKATSIIDENIKNLNVKNAQVLTLQFEEALKRFSAENISFDLIFLDPPYATNYIEISLNLIEKYSLLASGGLVICESSSLDKIIYPATFVSIKEKKYGDKWVVILKQIC